MAPDSSHWLSRVCRFDVMLKNPAKKACFLLAMLLFDPALRQEFTEALVL